VPNAIAAHQSIGIAAKAHRLSYLRDRWAEALRGDPRIEILTPSDPALHAGITSFRIKGKTSFADNATLRKVLFDRHRIFTIERAGPAKGACIRVSPCFINDTADMDRLTAALRDLAAHA
jgi:selenocysteine lyase/cysteine desulfurase